MQHATFTSPTWNELDDSALDSVTGGGMNIPISVRPTFEPPKGPAGGGGGGGGGGAANPGGGGTTIGPGTSGGSDPNGFHFPL